MTAPRTPTQRQCGTLDYIGVRTLIVAGYDYHQIAAKAYVSHSCVCSYVRRTGLAVGKHLRGRRSLTARKQRIHI